MNKTFAATLGAVAMVVSLMPVIALAQVPGTTVLAAGQDSADSQPSPSGSGEQGFRGGHHRHGAHGGFKKLNLSVDQQQQMDAIRKQLKTDNAPLFEKAKALKEQLDSNPKNADELKAQLTSLREQIRSAMKSGHERMMAVLTDDQKAQLAQAREQRKQAASGQSCASGNSCAAGKGEEGGK